MSETQELIPGLPEEIALECMTRFHYSTHQAAAGVCCRWRELLRSKDFYLHRKQSGHTDKAVCFVQAIQVRPGTDGCKPVETTSFGVSMFDPVSGKFDWLGSIPKYPDGIPLFCQLTSSEGKLVIMGGWNPASYEPVNDVFVYDFTTKQWKEGEEMPDTRSFFAAGEYAGKILIAGGHDENKNALCSAFAYDPRSDRWCELPPMCQDRDECQAFVMGSEFLVVSGYGSDNQGNFETSADSYNIETGRWRRMENVWERGQCPRSCTGLGKDGKLFSWAEHEAAVRVGTCAVDLNGSTILFGSPYQGEAQGFYIVNRQNRKLEKTAVRDGFQGLVQTGCSVEI
ncbi:hypothetical protein L6164_034000 [Bauhinia variegata]|uniref:Uncharacterized protein n=1 Tax=Bauhinia variegata TaxID=167791 RepID=A0ACB9KTV6_BAUVA|nr:hypothetical protein L6164_034000 [Bauhinia variegata]